MSNQYSRELPKDALGQKTTAAPREEIHESEWTTPVHLSGSDIAYDPKDDMHKIKSMQQKWRTGCKGTGRTFDRAAFFLSLISIDFMT